MASMLFRNGRTQAGAAVDILVEGGAIQGIGPADRHGNGGIDLAGRLIAPALGDAHVHLDKTFLGMPWRPHSAGPSVPHRIAAERAGRGALGAPVEARARALLEAALTRGSTLIRTHVDIDSQCRLDQLHGVLAAVEAFRGRIDVQIVAFPQSGILRDPGVADLLAAALEEGADLVGGLDPDAIDGDRAGHLDAVFALAGARGVGVDIHLHEAGEQGLLSLAAIAERAAALGLGGQTMVSHAFALATGPEPMLGRTIDALAAAGVALMTAVPGPGPLIPVERLEAAGCVVCLGSDNIRDAWSPFGDADMLDRARLLAYRSGWREDAGLERAYRLASRSVRTALGRTEPSLTPGAPADFIALEAENLQEAVVARPPGRIVVKAGRIVAQDGALAAV